MKPVWKMVMVMVMVVMVVITTSLHTVWAQEDGLPKLHSGQVVTVPGIGDGPVLLCSKLETIVRLTSMAARGQVSKAMVKAEILGAMARRECRMRLGGRYFVLEVFGDVYCRVRDLQDGSEGWTITALFVPVVESF